MARVKLTEYDAKRLLFPDLPVFPASTSTNSGAIKRFFGNLPLVVKIDQGIKKRGKKGLVAIKLSPVEVVAKIRQWSDHGYRNFLLEPVVEHKPQEEKYLSLNRTRSGWQVLYSDQGGIDIESNWDSVTSKLPPQMHKSIFKSLLPKLDKLHISSLELNPFIWKDNLIPLDAAAEIDDAALSLAELAPFTLNPVSDITTTKSELAISSLDASTPASLKYKLINPGGHIWMLLSGGGASLVLADEVADIGLGSDLANYGEYSGAPTADDTYAYTKIILSDLLEVKDGQPKALVIAGGVANFTDVAKTFSGLIKAMAEKQSALQKAKVKVFVRRGGPNEAKGLQIMRDFLNNSKLLGAVYGHETPLAQVIKDIKGYLS